MPKPFTLQSHDMAILLDIELSTNQGTTPEGYLICKNVPVSKVGVQYYLGQELGLPDKYNKRIPVYRLAEDVFEPESLQSLESKPLTDDHPQQAVNLSNVSFLSKGHGRNVRHDDRNVIADLVVTDPALIAGIRDKRKYEISLGYTSHYQPYKDGYKQTGIRINHIAVVETGRAGPKVSIRDSVKKRRIKIMDKKTAIATMFAAFAKDASPEELIEMMPFMTDSAPAEKVEVKTDKNLIEALKTFITKDAKPKEEEKPVTLDIEKMIADAVAKALAPMLAKDKKKSKDEAAEEIEKILEEEPEETADDGEEEEIKEILDDEPDDDEKKKTDDAAFANVVKAIQPLYKNLPKKEQKLIRDSLVSARKKPTADAYANILKAVKSHTKDAAPVWKDPSALSREVMAENNPHYSKKKA